MIRIRRLTWRVMWIRIGQEVPLRSLQGATSIWDQVWSLGLVEWNPTWHWVQLRKKMLPLAIWEVVCIFWKLLFDLVDLTCIFVWCRGEHWSSSMWSRSRSLETWSSSISSETGCLSINLGEARRFIRCKQTYRLSLDAISPGEDYTLSLNVIVPDVILCYKWHYLPNLNPHNPPS